MARIAVQDVKAGGFETDLTDPEIQEHIDDAHVEVDDRLDDADLSSERLDRIERDLARHSIKFTVEREVQSEKIGSLDLEYVGKFDEEGLKATPWGQNVLQWDTSNSFVDDTPGGSFEVF